MEKFRLEKIGLASRLHLYECPIELVEAAVYLSNGDAAVENLSPERTRDWFKLEIQMYQGQAVSLHEVRSMQFDVHLTRDQFLASIDFWESNGVYAVFSESLITMRALDLDDAQRYQVLDDFGWSMELAIPGPGGSPWGTIASPDPEVMDLLFLKAAIFYGD